MPTLARIGGLRFFFYSNEGHEPPHVHVERAEAGAKFWLHAVGCARSHHMSEHELRRIRAVVIEHRSEFLEAWHEFFDA